MDAILKKDNVFVYVKDLSYEVEKNSSFISSPYTSFELYGGRIQCDGNYDNVHDALCYLYIDGINIVNDWGINDPNDLPIRTVVAYLNQMEALGIEAFLENYKKALQEFEKELSGMEERLARCLTINDDGDERQRLNNIVDIHFKVSTEIFRLSKHMPINVENQKYEEVKQDFLSQF